MKRIESLTEDLRSANSVVRNRAAIELMDIGDPCAVKPLVEAILKPENVNHRGTLVYALEAFDCSAHIPLLVDLVLTGNYEVCAQACMIIGRMNLSEEHKQTIRTALAAFDKTRALGEHNAEGCKELSAYANR